MYTTSQKQIKSIFICFLPMLWFVIVPTAIFRCTPTAPNTPLPIKADILVSEKYTIWIPDSLVPLQAFSADSESLESIRWHFPTLDSTIVVGTLDTVFTAPSFEDSNFICIVGITTSNGGFGTDTMIAWITSEPDYRIAEPHSGQVFTLGDTIRVCMFPIESDVGIDLKFDRYTIDFLQNRTAGINPKKIPILHFPIPDKIIQKNIDFFTGTTTYDTIAPISESCVIRMTQYAVPNHYAESGVFAIRAKE